MPPPRVDIQRAVSGPMESTGDSERDARDAADGRGGTKSAGTASLMMLAAGEKLRGATGAARCVGVGGVEGGL